MKLPFVSRKRYNTLLKAHGEQADQVDRLLHEADHRERRLREELAHAREAIFHKKRADKYEEYLIQQKSLATPNLFVRNDQLTDLIRQKRKDDLGSTHQEPDQ